ncbi:GNAT family N-acetyltransferase [Lentilactobacillus rapi]|uniref:N-acetyltransferase n=2 Tax=Lentilactobacillus rapi TaxID=481723 RepID=A0A512PR77_9LACO|nr:GNAT family protein [Lentilactobacillus rapi]GEP73715.1 N-acetyltransferase [Lentilactobacillus rapi]
METDKIKIRPLQSNELKSFWQLAFSNPHAEWTKWNGPYFHDRLPSQAEFITTIGPEKWLHNEFHWVITFNDEIVGSVSAYFEDGRLKRWLEVGIVIYRDDLWGKHIGQVALQLWISHLFNQVTNLPHLGFTTWSGNQRMMALGDKVGMKLEGRIRQVRFWQGQYYDSVKYGILRTEWHERTTLF